MDNESKKCALCKKELVDNEKVLVIKRDDGEDEILCGICKEHVDTIKNSAYEEDKKASIKYFDTYIGTCGNPKVIKYLKSVVNSNTSAKSSNDSQSILNKNTSSGWIKGLKVGTWITVVVIIIYGIIAGVSAFEEDAMTGIIIIIVSPVVAFSAVALIMVFLEMAEDTRNSKILLSNIASEIKSIHNNMKKKD